MSAAPAMTGGPVRLALDWIAPERAVAPLADHPFTLMLHGGGQGARGRFSRLFALPDATIHTRDGAAGFAEMQRLQAEGRGVVAGLMAYDLGEAFEAVAPGPDALTGWPRIAMARYRAWAVFDHLNKTAWIEGEAEPAARLKAALSAPEAAPAQAAARAPLAPVWSESRYLEAARRAIEYVRAGDVFQVNLSHPFRAAMDGDAPLAVFQRLAQASPAAFAAYLRIDADRAVVTNSPERFVQVFAGGRVQARPVKGTRARGGTPILDAALAAELSASEKDRAENLMIVDLMRNDLARVCAAGSVRVPELFAVESFSNVHHLVSTIEGRLAEDRGAADLIAAAFPPGSITGAPKHRAMQIIAELEGEARGPYCGAMGWMDADGSADFNVMIRTAGFARHAEGGWDVEARSGGAITIESDPAAELAETHAKISALKQAIGKPS